MFKESVLWENFLRGSIAPFNWVQALKKGQRGRLKRTKSRALLERLIEFQDDFLRFIVDESVPFTNNQGESTSKDIGLL